MIIPNGPYVVPTMVEVPENTVFISGSTVRVNLSLSNMGVSDASQVYATLTPDNPMTMLQDSVFVGNISVNSTDVHNNAFAFVMPEAEDYVKLPFTLAVHWYDTTILRSVNVRVKLPKVTMEEYTATVNNTPVQNYSPGDEVLFTFKNKNKGHAEVVSGSVDLTCNYSGVTVTTDLSSISGLAPNTDMETSFQVEVADTVPAKSMIPLYYHIAYDNIHVVDTLYMLIGNDFEGFESGDFSQYNWTMNNSPWIITSDNPHSGNYCARSAQSLGNNSKSKMSITITTPSNASLSYYRKVSSEANWDKFFLYVDNTQMDEASGSSSWTYNSVDVAPGTHTFVFSYEKDYSQASGSDCAWIDDVNLPCVGIMVIEDLTDTTHVGVQSHAMVRASVYPNPSNEWVNVESENPVHKIVLFDMNGRVVKAINLSAANHYQLNMSDVPSGFYMMQITFDNKETQNLKIIKR